MYSRKNSLNISLGTTNSPIYSGCVYYNISMTLPGFQKNSCREEEEPWCYNGTFSSIVIWKFYGECLRASVCLLCSVLRLYNTQRWKCIKGRAIAVCWRLLVLRSNPDDPQTNSKKKIPCKNYLGCILHLFLCSQLIFLFAKKKNLGFI